MKKYYVYKINLTTLNFLCIFIYIILGIFTFFVFPKSFQQIIAYFENSHNLIILFPATIIYFCLHELFHAIGYIIHGANPKKLTFGAELEKGVFYCLCKQDISRKNILISSMYPLVFLGFITYVISIIFNLPLLLVLSYFNIGGAAGDIMYFIFISKLDKNIKFSELDDGISFAIKTKTKPKFNPYGLIFIKDTKTISRNDFQRVKISPLSWIAFLLCIVSIILNHYI